MNVIIDQAFEEEFFSIKETIFSTQSFSCVFIKQFNMSESYFTLYFLFITLYYISVFRDWMI